MYNSESISKILVVEDEADIQRVLCVYLEYSGFEVRGVSNGREAIQVIPEFCPHLIVLDIRMRPGDGWVVLPWLRSPDGETLPRTDSAPTQFHKVPVVLMTALTGVSEQARGFEEGAIEYLTKPTQPSKLVERIRNILELSVEEQLVLRSKRIDERRELLERLYAPQSDEFLY